MKQSILYILLVGLFIGCNTPKQAIKSINKGFSKDSVAASKRVREIVPCVTLKQDTVLVPKVTTNTVYDTTETVRDTTITLPCPDGTTVSTKFKTITYTIRSLTTNTNTYYITKTIEDKGKDIIIRDYQNKLEKSQSKKQFWMWYAIIATLVLLLGIIVFLLGKSLKK